MRRLQTDDLSTVCSQLTQLLERYPANGPHDARAEGSLERTGGNTGGNDTTIATVQQTLHAWDRRHDQAEWSQRKQTSLRIDASPSTLTTPPRARSPQSPRAATATPQNPQEAPGVSAARSRWAEVAGRTQQVHDL